MTVRKADRTLVLLPMTHVVECVLDAREIFEPIAAFNCSVAAYSYAGECAALSQRLGRAFKYRVRELTKR